MRTNGEKQTEIDQKLYETAIRIFKQVSGKYKNVANAIALDIANQANN